MTASCSKLCSPKKKKTAPTKHKNCVCGESRSHTNSVGDDDGEEEDIEKKKRCPFAPLVVEEEVLVDDIAFM